jgi:hypothetical protein
MKTHHGNEEWEAVMEMAKEDARRVPLPPDLFEVWNYLAFDFVVSILYSYVQFDLCASIGEMSAIYFLPTIFSFISCSSFLNVFKYLNEPSCF